jgi:hypothetical protein
VGNIKNQEHPLNQGPVVGEAESPSSLPHSRTLRQLSEMFVERFFPKGNAFISPPVNLHDSAHEFTNVPPTPRGEWQQTLVDVVGTDLLHRELGAFGFINDIGELGKGKDLETVLTALRSGVEKDRSGIRNEWRDPESSPYRALPVNDHRRLQMPPMTDAEIDELRRRGVEFYSQLTAQVRQAGSNGEVDWVKRYPEMKDFIANGPAAYIHDNPDKITINGGYDRPGTLPFGPIEQFMELPAEVTVDQGRARHHWVALLKQRSQMERRFILSKSDIDFAAGGGKVPGAPTGMSQDDYLKGLREARDRAHQVGSVAADEYEAKVRAAVSRAGGLKGYPPMLYKDPSGQPFMTLNEHNQLVQEWVQSGYGEVGSARMWNVHLDFDGADIAGQRNEAVLSAIADARKFGQMKEAIRGGTVRAATLAGAIPVLDPGTWSELGKGNLGAAGQRLATQAAVGIASSPVIGTVTGAAQRVAPVMVPRIIGGASIVGIATAPVAAAQAYDAFLEGSTGAGLSEHWQRLRDKAAGLPPSAMRELKEYPEGWITVPGKGRRWRDSEGNFYLEHPGIRKTTDADIARQVIPQLFPTAVSVPANTPTGVARLEAARPPPSFLQRARERVNLARERFNPAKGEWGLSELFFGR